MASRYPPFFSCWKISCIPIASRQNRSDRSRSETVSPVWCSMVIQISLSESDEKPAVDDDPLTRQIGVAGGDQMADGGGDLARLRRPAQWQPAMVQVDLPEPFRFQLINPIDDRHPGAREPRCHRVDQHAGRA